PPSSPHRSPEVTDRVRKCWIPADLGREDAAAVLDVPRGRLEGEGRGEGPGEGRGNAVLSGARHADG
ncbi:MAG: hypothetical protein AAGF12_37930, partial [Myxococcota bacterium]